ncbi:MAG: thioredoxin family protein [Desulfovibrio sp.]|nr:thioredoxin family protein [Desulfovibrio sp.]
MHPVRPCGLLAFSLAVTLLLGLLICPQAVTAEEVRLDVTFARDGREIVGAVRMQLPPGYHAYAHGDADAGRPTELDVSDDAQRAARVLYPAGALQRDYYDPDVTVPVYEGEVTLFALLPEASAGGSYNGSLSLLMCSPRRCVPVTQTLSGKIPADAPPVAAMAWAALWKAAARDAPAGGGAEPPAFAGGDAVQSGEKNTPLPPPESFPFRFTPRFADQSSEVTGLGAALLFGMLAGLLLNIMPCVLPVIVFKVTGILLMAGVEEQEKKRRFRDHNVFFAAGVVTFFTLLALLLGFADLMWGQIFQSRAVLVCLLLFVFLMGLSLLGVFTLPIIDLKVGTNNARPRLSAYLTGLTATLLATPCSGPLLGGVLAWAFVQSQLILTIVFWGIGIGMALPYLLFALCPGVAFLLPRPGRWMQIFQHIAGFFLLGTAVYFFSILPPEMHQRLLSILLVVAACAWLWGQFCGVNAPVIRRRVAGAVGLALLIGACAWAVRPADPKPQWKPLTAEYLAENLGKKLILIEFTADWCPNCKFMEATVLKSDRMNALKKRYDVELVRADLTETDAWAMRLLEALGSRSIPLTAVFPKGEGASSPFVLRDVYGAGMLEHALGKAAGL